MLEQGLPPEFTAYIPDVLEAHAAMVARAVAALPLAAGLGAVLAFRPRRRGTPARSAPVIQTQIVLSIVGAVVMLIVGSSLARAFGIVGVASLIRYRAKIDDPKDAVVMLATLSVGLCCGVELYGLALFSTIFILAILWVVESLEPEQRKTFDLKVVAPEPSALRAEVEAILRRSNVRFELRSAGAKDLVYEAQLPFSVRTDRIANAILQLQKGRTPRCPGKKRKRSERRPAPVALSAIVAELERDAEVLLPQHAHDFLQVVFRRRGDAQLIALDGRLYLLQLGVFDELDDVARLLGGDALLQRDLLSHGRVCRWFGVTARQVLGWHIASHQPRDQDLPQRIQLELVVGDQDEL